MTERIESCPNHADSEPIVSSGGKRVANEHFKGERSALGMVPDRIRRKSANG